MYGTTKRERIRLALATAAVVPVSAGVGSLIEWKKRAIQKRLRALGVPPQFRSREAIAIYTSAVGFGLGLAARYIALKRLL